MPMPNLKNVPNQPNEEQAKLLNSLMNNLNADDAARVQQVLSDKSATEKILSTPQAQALLQKLLGGK